MVSRIVPCSGTFIKSWMHLGSRKSTCEAILVDLGSNQSLFVIYKLLFCGTVYVTCMYKFVCDVFSLGACQNPYIVCRTPNKVHPDRYSPTVEKKHTFFCMQCTPVKHLCTCKISSSASRLGRTTPEMSFWKFQGQNRNSPHCLSFIFSSP